MQIRQREKGVEGRMERERETSCFFSSRSACYNNRILFRVRIPQIVRTRRGGGNFREKQRITDVILGSASLSLNLSLPFPPKFPGFHHSFGEKMAGCGRQQSYLPDRDRF